VNKIVTENLSLSALLARLSGHMDGLATEVHRIEHAIGDELGRTAAQGAQTITRLQRLDFLRQSTEDLALLLYFLSKDHDGTLDRDLAENVRLDVTKALIKDRKSSGINLLPDENTMGEVDLF
jgi:hypothetical protein